MATKSDRPRVVIAGGGVAALEGCLALRTQLDAETLDITLLTTSERFHYRPLAVLEPFGAQRAWSLDLAQLAADQDVDLRIGSLFSVDPERRAAVPSPGPDLSYDVLLVAIGAQPVQAIPGAVTFGGSADADLLRGLLAELEAWPQPHVVFALPPAASWPLPLYELALLTSAHLRARGVDARLTLVTGEAAPLELFGARASEVVGGLLQDAGIGFVGDREPVGVRAGALQLQDGRRVNADRVVSLPRLVGRRVAGLPHVDEDFIPVDEHGRVRGVPHVYAAGDLVDFPIKQGGLAAQQADAAAEAMLAELGFPVAPRPFRPVLQGVLYTGRDAAYLRAPLGEPAAASAEPRPYSLWWPPSKIAGRHLSPYLVMRGGAPRAPERRPDADIVPVHVELGSP